MVDVRSKATEQRILMSETCTEHEWKALTEDELAAVRKQSRQNRPNMAWLENVEQCSRCGAMEGVVSWVGSPLALDYATLTGGFNVNVESGQFLKADPGLAKLLSVLSLQSLPRRITLDFRDIFSDGFAFDQIVGTARISDGIATTENFRIIGPSARVTMSGDVDLARETQKLRVRITPSISDSVSIAGALIGGPVAGVAAYLAQKILKDPLDQLVSYEYGVTGTWSDPQVAKIDRPAATVPEGTP